MRPGDEETGEKRRGFLRRYKYYILVPMGLVIVLWLLLMLLTDDMSVAPFIYATH